MMGASTSSSNGIRPPTPISTSERAAKMFSYSEDARPVNDRKQNTSYIYAERDQPQSQNPSPYATLRTGEFCDQRSTAPSLSNVSPPKRETLLAYATQMTGWQPADSRDSSVLQHNSEVMELSRIISQLAMANHQLASAHNTALARMEALYLELSRDKEDRKRRISTEALEICDDILRKRLLDAEESEEARKLEQRVVRLERLLATSSVGQCKQKGQEDNKSRSKIENFSKIRDTKDSRSRSAESCCESSQQRTMGHIAIDVSEVPDDRGEDAREGTDVHRCAHCDDSESNVPRIDENSCSASVDLDKTRRRRARLRESEQESATKNLVSEEMLRLSREIRRLEADRLECQSANEQLLCNLANQEDLLRKLSVDYEELKSRYATVEANFHEHKQQHDDLTKHLDIAKRKIERLLKEIDVFQSEKDTADARISTLEQDLQKSLLEKEQIRNAESQKASKLRAQLSEEVSDKKKQIKALEDALQEIQRLKETVKTERKNENGVAPKEDIDAVDLTDDVSENALTADRSATNMEEFKKELSLKREARHRAIAAVSSEMERLRRDLDAEKEAHSETSSMLALLRSARSDSQDLDIASRGDSKSTTRGQEARERADENGSELRRAEALRLTNTLKVSDELRNDVRNQIEKVDDLRYHLETDPERHQRRIQCLAEVSSKSRESLVARERRTNELKNYLAQVLVRLGDRSFLNVRDDTGAECDRQLENINALKALYNERLRVLTELKDSAIKELTDVKQKLEYTVKKSENLEEELKKAEEKVDAQDSEITNLESQLGLTKADCRDLQNQMSLINGLFTQMLLGASSADMDLDRLTQLLQENHDLISDIAREESTEAAALPKLLLDLVEQVEGGKASQKHASEENGEENEIDRKEEDLQEENIAHNLPKVWRVLLELLSCHAVTSPSVSVASCSDPNSCYKSVDTPAGPRLVISVSKTYIRLKELILEKKHLEKEMNRMKQLNTHLESKLGEQEKRLSMVSTELAKTWNIVGRMQAQHQQLHTHEEILRYELQQKRKMLQELKQELEYCREKWESARQKNTNTELEWRSLRREFAARKALAAHDSFNSAESGFSDERGDDSDEEEEAIEGRIRHGLRRRTRKESARAPTPDTESEQPTDTELSESKTGSSVTLEQRTPTPETEAELDEAEVARVDSELIDPVSEPAPSVENTPETLDPLDQALTNVIQNLIEIDHAKSGGSGSILREDSTTEDPRDNSTFETNGDAENRATISKTDFCSRNPRLWTPTTESWCSLPTAKTLKRSATSVDLPSAVDNGESTESSNVASRISSRRRNEIDEVTKSESVPSSPVSHASIVAAAADAASATPVFSIGPLPTLTAPSIKSVQFSDPLIVGPSNRFSAPVFGAIAAELDNSEDTLVASTDQFSSKEKEGAVENTEQVSSKPVESVIDSDSISVDSSSSLDTVREFPTADRSPTPLSTSVSAESATISPKEVTLAKSRTPEEVLATRADRLKRLEEQADWLMKKMNATSKRGDALCTRLEELHDVYGEPPVPPPMPDVLPSRRLPSSLPASPPQVSELMSAGNAENAEDESSHVMKNDTSSASAKEP